MWTWASLVVVFGACYAPTLTTGAPCDPGIDNCPAGQVCSQRGPGEFRCGGPGEASSDAAIDSQTAIDAADDAPIGDDAAMMIDAPMIDAPLPLSVEYVAVVADCVNPAVPNPDTCKTVNGATYIAIDANDSATDNPWIGFLRFDLDNVLAGRIVTSLRLRLVASSNSNASAPNSGRIWQVGPFARTDLFVAPVPARIGATLLAGTQGSVEPLQVITWTLPVSLAVANGSVYLEIETVNSDGTTYWNLAGPNPPRLLIDLQ